ncbi:MAG: SBBP repeat-containing protein [Ardenticatenales bacterium]|nr:SBBP repeat-containing protein [Ardenticatenales bacterium]
MVNVGACRSKPPASSRGSLTPNAGHTHADVRFTTDALGGTIFFAGREVVLSLPVRPGQPSGSAALVEHPQPPARHVVRQRFEGTHQPTIQGTDELPGRAHVLQGADSASWQRNLPTYGTLRYPDLYPGIELRYSGSDGALKSTYTIAPGADPTQIRWRYAGAARPEIDPATGALRVALRAGGETLMESAPIAWQAIGGVRVPVTVAYRVEANGRVGFTLGAYDPAYALVIDPVLSYSTYLGGSAYDQTFVLTSDAAGNVYVTGMTQASGYPTSSGPIGTTGGYDVLVTKFDPDGEILYSTYLGGSGDDAGRGLAVDSTGQVVIVGNTTSNNFPTLGGYSSTYAGGTCADAKGCNDAFVVQLSADGTTLLYGSYLGGATGDDIAVAAGVDITGTIYLAGYTYGGLPTVAGSYDTSHNGTNTLDGFVAKVNPVLTGTASLVWSSYLGGSGQDVIRTLAVDEATRVYVAGDSTSGLAVGSGGFPRTGNPLQSGTYGGNRDAFLAHFSANGQSLLYSSFLGGSASDSIWSMTYPTTDTLYLTGLTLSTNFPTTTLAYQGSLGGGQDGFVARWQRTTPSALGYSSYLGGAALDEGRDIAVAADGRIYLTGRTSSDNFPVLNAVQSTRGGDEDLFITSLNAAGSALVYSSYLGGTLGERGYGITLTPNGHAYVTGVTYSSNFPVTSDAHDLTFGGPGKSDAFLARFTEPITLTGFTLHQASPTTIIGQTTMLSATVSAGNLVSYTWNLGDGTVKTGAAVTHTYAQVGTYSVLVTATNPLTTLTDTLWVEILPPYTTLERVLTYEYDDLYRLTGADYSTGESFAYQYDAVGNRTVMTDAAGTHLYTFDAASRLSVADGITHTWDATGNLLADGTRTYSYNAANRLTSVNDGTAASSYVYDGAGNRVSQTVGGVTTHYVLDVAGALPEVIAATGSSTTHYVQIGGQILGQMDSGTWGYVLPDHLGSVRQLADGSGDVMLTQQYAPFGETMDEAGPASSVFGFAGEQTDATGLQYLRARTYAPELGQFIQVDPFAGWSEQPYSLHPYQYSSNNPVKYTDPSGFCAQVGDEACWAVYEELLRLQPHLETATVQYYGESVPLSNLSEAELRTLLDKLQDAANSGDQFEDWPIWKWVLYNEGSFFDAAGDQFLYNELGFFPIVEEALETRPYEYDDPYRMAGRIVGSTASLCLSAAEFVDGGTRFIAGTGMCVVGATTGPGEVVICGVGLAQIVVGSVEMVHAAGVGVVSAGQLVEHGSTLINMMNADWSGGGEVKRDVAMGLNADLTSFTKRVNATNYLNWMEDGLVPPLREGSTFGDQLDIALNNAETIHFNLKGLDINLALERGASVNGGWTNRELYLILHNRSWYDKTTFYDATGAITSLKYLGD